MHYYEVLVATATYHGEGPLTYSSEGSLVVGDIVHVPLKRQKVMGIVTSTIPKPPFSAKKLSTILGLPAISEKNLQLITWLQEYYPAPLGMIVQQFLPKLLSEKLIRKNTLHITISQQKSSELPALTHEQVSVLQTIDAANSYLLHGETGSGKTRIYIELARQALGAGRSVLILSPEISLTSQLQAEFQTIFGDQVMLVHSDLSEAVRRSTWLTILRSTEPLIVIGTRSALFSPFRSLGLIVVDEAHETAYKQEQAPHYHALRVASKLAELWKAQLIIGSATPSVTDYFMAKVKQKPILRMQHVARPEHRSHNNYVHIVDLRDRSLFTRANNISDPLLTATEQALQNNEQTLLFLNRRGTARVVMCQNCGWQALCPHCDIPLTYHADGHLLRCHTCGYRHTPPPNQCPTCLSPEILFKSIGTKAVVEEIQRLFPQARVERFDTDSKKTENFASQYSNIKAGDVDILVGTQTLAKGLDLPRLSVVGVITADTSLYMPDYTATERTYQLVSQVAGRIGRGHIAGQAIIQTYQPESPIMQAAALKDWEAFYSKELAERRAFLFPPFCFLLKLTCRRTNINTAHETAEAFTEALHKHPLKIQIHGPNPAFHEKVGKYYQWQLIIKAKERSELLKVIKLLPSGWSYDIDPIDLL